MATVQRMQFASLNPKWWVRQTQAAENHLAIDGPATSELPACGSGATKGISAVGLTNRGNLAADQPDS
jgi:hypothetical protein